MHQLMYTFVLQDPLARIGRLTFPISMLAFPFYLLSRSPGKQGSHYDPKADLFVESEEPLVGPSAQPAFVSWCKTQLLLNLTIIRIT